MPDIRPAGMSCQARVAGVVAGGLLLLGFPAASASASVAPTSISPNVQVDTRSPSHLGQNFKDPSVVINPADPNDIVVATRSDDLGPSSPGYTCEVWYSRNGGATWAASSLPAPVVAPNTGCWAPGAAFDASGQHVYVSAQERVAQGSTQNPQDMIVWASSDGGQTFAAPVVIPASRAFASPPPASQTPSGNGWQGGIAIDNGSSATSHPGRVYVTWEFSRGRGPTPAHDRTNLAYSDDNGQTWSGKVEETSFPVGNEELPKLAVAPDGTVYVVYRASQPNQLPPSSGTCDGFGFKSTAPPYECPAGVLRYTPAAGTGFVSTFDTNVQAAPAHFTTNPAASEDDGIAVAADGTILVTYAAVPNPPTNGCSSLDVFVVRSTDRGATWSTTPTRLSDDPCGSGSSHRDPWISIAPNGRVDAIWNDNRNDMTANKPAYDTYYANSTDGGQTFGPNVRVTSTSFDGTSLFTPVPTGFQTNEYDTHNGIASTNNGAVGAWADTRNDTGNAGLSDVFASSISFVTPPPPPGTTPPGTTPPGTTPPGTTPPGVKPPVLLPRANLPGLRLSGRRRVRRRQTIFVIRGALRLPAGILASQRASVCHGLVTVAVRRGHRTGASRTVHLRRDCSFSLTVAVSTRKLGGKGRFNIRVRFHGNANLNARSQTTNIR